MENAVVRCDYKGGLPNFGRCCAEVYDLKFHNRFLLSFKLTSVLSAVSAATVPASEQPVNTDAREYCDMAQ